MIGFYNYTVLMTYFSLLLSCIGLFLTTLGRPIEAMILILLSGVCDMLDGKIARTRKKSTDEEKRFGIQLDSLCDIICFGAFPAVVGITIMPADNVVLQICAWVTGFALILCALIRLAYFNVTEETRQATEGGLRRYYMGLPVTTSAIIFPAAFIIAQLIPSEWGLLVYPVAAALTSLFFILPIRIPKPHGFAFVVLGAIGSMEGTALTCLFITDLVPLETIVEFVKGLFA